MLGALFPLPVSSFDVRKLLLHQRLHHLKLHAKTRSSFQRLVECGGRGVKVVLDGLMSRLAE